MDRQLVSPAQVSKSGRYVAPQLPCPYLDNEAVGRDGKPLRRRRQPQTGGVGPSATGSAAPGVRPRRRSRSVPPQATHGARSRSASLNSPLAAACKAYNSAPQHRHRPQPHHPHAHGLPHASRARRVFDSILEADALRLEESLLEYGLELYDPQGLREIWARISAAADEMGVDAETFARLYDMQHRDIGPEDYETLQRLEATVKPKTLQARDVERFMTAYVGSRGQLIAKAAATLVGAPSTLPEGAGADGFTTGLQCVVCMEEFRLGDAVRVLPCRHFFHQSCIDNWLTGASKTCPVDGMEVPVGTAEAAGALEEGCAGRVTSAEGAEPEASLAAGS